MRREGGRGPGGPGAVGPVLPPADALGWHRPWHARSTTSPAYFETRQVVYDEERQEC